MSSRQRCPRTTFLSLTAAESRLLRPKRGADFLVGTIADRSGDRCLWTLRIYIHLPRPVPTFNHLQSPQSMIKTLLLITRLHVLQLTALVQHYGQNAVSHIFNSSTTLAAIESPRTCCGCLGLKWPLLCLIEIASNHLFTGCTSNASFQDFLPSKRVACAVLHALCFHAMCFELQTGIPRLPHHSPA